MNINKFFETAVEKQASDIHLIVGKPPILRINGQLSPIPKIEILNQLELEKFIFSLLTPNQKEKFIKRRDLDFSYETSDGSRFRVNILWEKDNVGLVARIISSDVPTMEEVGLPRVVYDMICARQGLVLVTGPTGCGKSTSLAAMINQINNERAVNIVTLEDPIEYIFKPEKSIIMQRQLGTDMISFQSALKHVVRQDPDVIMVGEMRDFETIAATLTLAETGHLVLATLHTYNSSQTIDRIVDVFPPFQQNQIRLQLSLSLNGVISQQLLPKKGGGRIATREVLINNPAIVNIIRENKIPQIKTAIQTSADEGMFTLQQDLRRLLKEGLVEKEVVEYYLQTLPKI
ncbi:PilT/PilU family type 4a pilus ATPase [Patescibacteria group bacterium]|nr:PilT/PilU family type 4a pilus ATPase [Patescibacteria group bacterium]